MLQPHPGPRRARSPPRQRRARAGPWRSPWRTYRRRTRSRAGQVQGPRDAHQSVGRFRSVRLAGLDGSQGPRLDRPRRHARLPRPGGSVWHVIRRRRRRLGRWSWSDQSNRSQCPSPGDDTGGVGGRGLRRRGRAGGRTAWWRPSTRLPASRQGGPARARATGGRCASRGGSSAAMANVAFWRRPSTTASTVGWAVCWTSTCTCSPNRSGPRRRGTTKGHDDALWTAVDVAVSAMTLPASRI